MKKPTTVPRPKRAGHIRSLLDSAPLFCLLLSTVALLALYPYFPGGAEGGSWTLRFFPWVVPIFGVYAVSDDRRLLAVSLLFGVPSAVGALQTEGAIIPSVVAVASTLVFFGFTTAVILVRVVRSSRVTADTIYGAISAYLLMGLTWAMVYSAVEAFVPGSFYLASSPDSVVTPLDLLYFSFVSLTTLGYGDILPVTHQARSLAILETVTGVMYLTTLVARLVAMYTSDSRSRAD